MYTEYQIDEAYTVKVYESGKVDIISYKGSKVGKELTQYCHTYNTKGYMRVEIHGRKRYVHSLVAEVVYGPRPNGMQVNHIDGNKLNNHPRNLVYCTPTDNIRHAVYSGLRPLSKTTIDERAEHGERKSKEWLEAHNELWYKHEASVKKLIGS